MRKKRDGMTVGTLLYLLGKFPPETLVGLHGYEGGYKYVGGMKLRPIVLDVNEEPYYGPHEDWDKKPEYAAKKRVVMLVLD